MSKCICKQIAEMIERNECGKIHVCTGHAGICGYVDIDATKSADGLLVMKNAKIIYENDCEKNQKMVDNIGISGLHIVSFHCGELEI